MKRMTNQQFKSIIRYDNQMPHIPIQPVAPIFGNIYIVFN